MKNPQMREISNEGNKNIKLLRLCITKQIVPVSVSTNGTS